MDDFMDSLVKEVEGNMKPIRAEKLDDISTPDTGSADTGSTDAGKDAGNAEAGKDLFLHVHRENVKCYRNTQAVIVETGNGLKQEMEKRYSGIHNLLLVVLILLILNLGAAAFLILNMIFRFI